MKFNVVQYLEGVEFNIVQCKEGVEVNVVQFKEGLEVNVVLCQKGLWGYNVILQRLWCLLSIQFYTDDIVQINEEWHTSNKYSDY